MKPAPVTVAALIVTGAVPVDVKTTDCVAPEFTSTFPNPTFVALTLSVGTAAFNCIVKVFDALPAVAVNVAVCVVPTDDMAAVNPAVFAPAGTVSVKGTATAALLLANLTTKPPLEAALLSVTVQESELAPVSDEDVHESAVRFAGTEVPVPLRPMTAVALLDESLVIVSWPVAAPTVAGSNWTLSVAA